MEIHVEPFGRDTSRLLVYGELDMASRGLLLDAVTEVVSGLIEAAMIEVDLTEASFLDAAGVGALVDARNAVAAAGRRLRVRGADGLVLQILQICGVADLLGEETGDQATGGQGTSGQGTGSQRAEE